MLKYFYRLKKGRGVVLFVVIAFMTLLISMASVAYFTARSSFTTVIQNYDSSQLYISTTAVADMILDALTETTSKPGSQTSVGSKILDSNKDVSLNYFDGLKDKVKGLTNLHDKLEGVSSNIKYADKDNLAAMIESSQNDPIEPGILDGIKTTFEIIAKKTHSDDASVPSGVTRNYFRVTTVGFYRGNTVTVSDNIYNDSGTVTTPSTPSFDTFFTATGQELKSGSKKHIGRAVVINNDEISDNAYFQSDFTIFTQGRNNVFKGGLRSTGGIYIDQGALDIPAPSGNTRHDWIIGGDLWIGGNLQNVNLNGNDLYVKGDLYICRNSVTISAGSVFVEGNVFVINNNNFQFNITGSTAIKDTTTYPSGVYIGGDIYQPEENTVTGTASSWSDGKQAMVEKLKELDGTSFTETNWPYTTINYDTADMTLSDLTIKDEKAAVDAMIREAYANVGATGVSSTISYSFEGAGWGKWQSNAPVYHVTKKSDGTPTKFENTDVTETKITDTSIFSKIQVDITKSEENGNAYVDKLETMTVDAVLDTSPGKNLSNREYDNFTAKTETLNNVLELDFTGLSRATGGSDAHKVGEVAGKAANLYFNQTDNHGNKCTVLELPYVENGYILKYKNYPPIESTGDFGWFNVRIHSGDKAMPIVLTANTIDNGEPVFTWKATTASASGQGALVEIIKDGTSISDATSNSGEGYVMFEMANYEKADADNIQAIADASSNQWDYNNVVKNLNKINYTTYDPANSSIYDTIKYRTTEYEFVGTANQWSKITTLKTPKETNKTEAYKEFLQDDPSDSTKKTDDAISAYDNKIMFVSNRNDGKVAFDGWRQNTMFCGYFYAPNGTYGGYGDQALPIVGGMIVEDYVVKDASFLYMQPDPNLIKSLGSAFNSPNGGSSTTTIQGDWTTMGKNYEG